MHQATEHHQWSRAKTVFRVFFTTITTKYRTHIKWGYAVLYKLFYIRKEDKCSRLVVAVATVVATPGPVPEVAAAVRLEARREAAGSGAATAGGIAAEASSVAARVGGGTVASAAAARGDLLVGRWAQHLYFHITIRLGIWCPPPAKNTQHLCLLR